MARSTEGDLDRLSASTGTNVERDVHDRTPEGLAHLRQIIDAALFVFCIVAGAGLPTFRRFLELAGLTPYVASSCGALQARLSALEAAYIKECNAERAPFSFTLWAWRARSRSSLARASLSSVSSCRKRAFWSANACSSDLP